MWEFTSENYRRCSILVVVNLIFNTHVFIKYSRGFVINGLSHYYTFRIRKM